MCSAFVRPGGTRLWFEVELIRRDVKQPVDGRVAHIECAPRLNMSRLAEYACRSPCAPRAWHKQRSLFLQPPSVTPRLAARRLRDTKASSSLLLGHALESAQLDNGGVAHGIDPPARGAVYASKHPREYLRKSRAKDI